jgi:hypothetical protein
MYLYCPGCTLRYGKQGGNTFCKECGKKLADGADPGYVSYGDMVWTDWEATEAAAKEAIKMTLCAGHSSEYTSDRTGEMLNLGQARSCAAAECERRPCDTSEIWCASHSGGCCVHCAFQLPLPGANGEAPYACPQCDQASPYPLQTPEFAAEFSQIVEEHAEGERTRTKCEEHVTWDSTVVNRHK